MWPGTLSSSHMFCISGIIAFQTKKLNFECDLRKETDIKWEIGNFHTPFLGLLSVNQMQ